MVDPEARTARIQAGVRWGQVVAVSYTWGGGLGTLAREFGYAADHVRWPEVVNHLGGALARPAPETRKRLARVGETFDPGEPLPQEPRRRRVSSGGS